MWSAASCLSFVSNCKRFEHSHSKHFRMVRFHHHSRLAKYVINSFEDYVADRITEITKLVPPGHWRYVSTRINPANLVSRGLYVQELLNCFLRWQGPNWSAENWSRRPDINLSRELPELKSAVTLLARPTQTTFDLSILFFQQTSVSCCVD